MWLLKIDLTFLNTHILQTDGYTSHDYKKIHIHVHTIYKISLTGSRVLSKMCNWVYEYIQCPGCFEVRLVWSSLFPNKFWIQQIMTQYHNSHSIPDEKALYLDDCLFTLGLW